MRILIVFAAAIVMLGGLFAAIHLYETSTHVGNVVLAVLVGVAAAVGLWWLSRLDDRLKQKSDSNRVAHADDRFKHLMVLARAHDFELKVKGASQLSFALIALAFGSTAFFPGADWILRVFAVAVAIPIGIVLLLQALPKLGRPVITLTRAGFRTPISPDIPWRLVDGIHYSEKRLSANDSGAKPYGELTFYVPTLPQEISRFSPLFRLMRTLGAKRNLSRIMVTLRKTSEPPSAVGRLAEQLWTQSTGRTNDWNFYTSDEENAALRELRAADAVFRKQMETDTPDVAVLEKHLAQLKRYNNIVANEGRSRTRQDFWAIAIVVLVVVGFIVGSLLRIF